MLRVEDLIRVIKMEQSIGPKPCGCSPSRDCPHDPPDPIARTAPPGDLPVGCTYDDATGEPPYRRCVPCPHGVPGDETCLACPPARGEVTRG